GDYWPSWSPDGEWISFIRTQPTNNYFKIRPDGTDLTQLTSFPNTSANGFSTNGSPAIWLPDGSGVLLPAKIGGVQGIYAVAANGSGVLRRIPTAEGAEIDFVGSAVIDQPPRVSRFDPAPDNAPAGVRTVTAFFTRPLDPTTVTPGSVSLIFAGADGILDTTDDVSVPIPTVKYNTAQSAVELHFNLSLSPGLYRVTVSNSIRDSGGRFMTHPFQSDFVAGIPNLIVNGDFEQPALAGNGDIYSSDSRFSLPGWTVPKGGNQFFLEYGEPFSVARHSKGRQSVCINGDGAPVKLSQTFATVAGASYHLQFALGEERSGRPSPTRVMVEVADFKQEVAIGSTASFAIEGFTFIAPTAQTTLTFTDLTSAAGDSPFIDDVFVSGPEPPSAGQ
ncbi:MAG TPA: DUF642 domain-containing protein, partial [Verrucomicrobiae bacterium]|nr:DUF642 domain-containing protein [Verrucomicrobiae bacterium]